MNTDKEHLQHLMAIAEQSREAQRKYFEIRNGFNLRDAKIKEDSLDNLLKFLRTQGYLPQKIVSKLPEQQQMF